MVRKPASRQLDFLSGPMAYCLLFFLFIAGEFCFVQFDQTAMVWITAGAFVAVIAAMALSSGAFVFEFRRVHTNERPKPAPQKITIPLPANTVQIDDAWKDAPALDAEFSRESVEHKPARPTSFHDYRRQQHSRSAAGG